MYQVEKWHHKKEYRRGDLEDDTVLEQKELFKTRKAAKEYIISKAKCIGELHVTWHKGDKPTYAVVFTGRTWTNENTGEKQEEYYQYVLKKAVVH